MSSKTIGTFPTAQEAARYFHYAYERLASLYGFETKKEDLVEWMELPEHNRRLLIETCKHLLNWLRTGRR